MFKIGDMVCRCKTLSKTGRTTRPYALAATVFLFTSITEFTVPRTLSFSIRLLEKGSEGSAYRISFKEKLSGRLKSIEWLGSPLRDRNKKLRCSEGHTIPIANVGPEPRTDMSGKSFSSLMPPR